MTESVGILVIDRLSTSGSANDISGIPRAWKNAPEKSGLVLADIELAINEQ